MGEFEADDKLSFKASSFHFVNGSITATATTPVNYNDIATK
jgi:hypothetical protein